MESIVGSLGLLLSVAGTAPSNHRTSLVIGSLTRHDLIIACLVLAMLVCGVFVFLCLAYLKALNEAQQDSTPNSEFKKHDTMDIKLPKSMSSQFGLFSNSTCNFSGPVQ